MFVVLQEEHFHIVELSADYVVSEHPHLAASIFTCYRRI
jgi:hypothetical protein